MTDLNYVESAKRPCQIGMIVLQADETLERDFRRLLPDDVELLVTRVPSGEELSAETIGAMQSNLTQAASLLPRGARFAAVGYGCTSASAQIGSDRVAGLIGAGVEAPHVTDPVVALIAACAALGVTRIGMITPYVADVSDRLRVVLAEAGVETVQLASFNEASEAKVVRISESSIRDAAVSMGRDTACDAVFLSCTNLRTLGVIEDIERAIGKPVLASNTVLAWHLLRLAGVPSQKGPGRLFST